MHDDVFGVFIITICLTTLALPDVGQVAVGLFGFVMVLLVRAFPDGEPEVHQDDSESRHMTGY